MTKTYAEFLTESKIPETTAPKMANYLMKKYNVGKRESMGNSKYDPTQSFYMMIGGPGAEGTVAAIRYDLQKQGWKPQPNGRGKISDEDTTFKKDPNSQRSIRVKKDRVIVTAPKTSKPARITRPIYD